MKKVPHRAYLDVDKCHRVWSDLSAFGLALGFVTALAALWYHAGLLVNHSRSMPLGVYRVVRLTGTQQRAVLAGRLIPVRGAIVVWCLPPDVASFARLRRYVLRGSCPGGVEPVLKRVAAVPGDTIVVDAAGLRVNGRALANSRALARDAQDRPTAAIALERFVVRAGTAWLWSPYSERSYDSRYFGAVPLDGWVGMSHPILVDGARQGRDIAASQYPSP